MSSTVTVASLKTQVVARQTFGCLGWLFLGLLGCWALIVLCWAPFSLLISYSSDSIEMCRRIARNQGAANATVVNATDRACSQYDEGTWYRWTERDANYEFEYEGKKYSRSERDTDLNKGQTFPVYFDKSAPGGGDIQRYDCKAIIAGWEETKSQVFWKCVKALFALTFIWLINGRYKHYTRHTTYLDNLANAVSSRQAPIATLKIKPKR